jgi:hypothetical protein
VGGAGNWQYRYTDCAGIPNIVNGSSNNTFIDCARTFPVPYFYECGVNKTCSVTNLNTECI